MKKITLGIIFTSLLTLFLMNQRGSTIEPLPFKEETTPSLQTNSEVTDKKAENANLKKRTSIDHKEIKKNIPSLSQLEREYRNHSLEELLEIRTNMKVEIEEKQLITKANNETITTEEYAELIWHIRKEGVINFLILQKQSQARVEL